MKKDTRAKVNIVVLYGAMAIGKLTVGKVLEKIIGYKLTHNHLINDLVLSVFERGTVEANFFIEKLRYEFYEAAAKYGNNLIITHCYSHNYVSPTGLSDPRYLITLEKCLEKAGARVFFVHLQAGREVLLDRVRNKSRKEHKKLTRVSIMRGFLDTKDFTTSAPVKNNLVIDNSNLSPKSVAQIIAKYIKR